MHATTYAIGDIHGRLDLLDALLDTIDNDARTRGSRALIVFTGDYVDRGADSFGVVERLMAGPRRAEDRFICLRGNHDDLFVKAIRSGEGVPDWAWQLFGHTIVSYGLKPGDPAGEDHGLLRHAAFLAGLPLSHDDGRRFFVHAGIRPGVPIERQADEDLLWIRAEFLDHDGRLPRQVVHGHTIMGDHPVVTANRISIDTGAYRSGILSAAVLDGDSVAFLQAIGEPDRGAIVRETKLFATVHGRTLEPAMQSLLDDLLAYRITVSDFETRSSMLFAA